VSSNGNGGPSGYQPGRVAKLVSSTLVFGFIGLILVFIASRAGCVNLDTPPGHEVQSLDASSVKSQSGPIAEQVLAAMQARYKDSPIEVLSVDIGDVNYHDVVVQSVIRKFVTEEDNLRKDIELKIAQREIDIGVADADADAEGTADAQRIIRTTLDPMFLHYEALGAIEQLAGAPNTTFVVTPTGPNGSPMIMSVDK
jgi:regulator of protease activity HflC (stomatin/prohibitin superfamily)